MLKFVVFVLWFAVCNSDLLFYLVDIDTGKVLAESGNSVKFVDQAYGDISQTWQFNTGGKLKVNGKSLLYITSTKVLGLSQTSQTKWSYENMRIKSSDGLCVGKTTPDLKAVACDSGCNITLSLNEESLYNHIQELETEVRDSITMLNDTLKNTTKEVEDMKTNIMSLQTNLVSWNVNFTKLVTTYTSQTDVIDDKMINTKGHLEQNMEKLTAKMATLDSSVTNLTSNMTSLNTNFTALHSSLTSYQNATNATIQDQMSALQRQLDTKSTNGHIVPDNVFEFGVIFLLALGVVNVGDVIRRVIVFSVNQRAHGGYGTE